MQVYYCQVVLNDIFQRLFFSRFFIFSQPSISVDFVFIGLTKHISNILRGKTESIINIDELFPCHFPKLYSIVTIYMVNYIALDIVWSPRLDEVYRWICSLYADTAQFNMRLTHCRFSISVGSWNHYPHRYQQMPVFPDHKLLEWFIFRSEKGKLMALSLQIDTLLDHCFIWKMMKPCL